MHAARLMMRSCRGDALSFCKSGGVERVLFEKRRLFEGEAVAQSRGVG
jgi:hypothetical protein